MLKFLADIFNPLLVLEMVSNVYNFTFWLLILVKDIAYTYVVVLPSQLLKFLINFALAPLHPIFSTCNETGCVVNDTGRAFGVAILMLGIVGLLKWRGQKQKI